MLNTVIISKNSSAQIQSKDIHIVYGRDAIYDKFALQVPEDKSFVLVEKDVYELTMGCMLMLINLREQQQGRPDNLDLKHVNQNLMRETFIYFYKPVPDP